MSYTKQSWSDGPQGGTPISGARLQHLEDGIQALSDALGNGTSLALTPTAVKTAAYTAAVGDLVPVDTTSGSVTVTLPTTPADKAQISVKHVVQGGSNTVTIAAGGSDVFNKTGGSTSLTLSTPNQLMQLQYKASSSIWYVVNDSLAKSALDLAYASAKPPAYVIGATKTYERPGFLFNGESAKRRAARSVLAKAFAGTALTSVLCVGDSETAGFGATPGVSDYPMVLRKQLAAAGYPIAGTGWVFAHNNTTRDARWTVAGGWSGGTNQDQNFVFTTSNGAVATFTSDLPGTIVEFATFAASPSVTITVDGATPANANVTLTNGATYNNGVITPGVAQAISVVTISGLSNAAHTLVVTKTSTGTSWLIAARCRNATGLSVTNAGVFAAQIGDWLPTAKTSAYWNLYNSTLTMAAPDLVLMMLAGGNEALHNISIATAKTNLQTLVAAYAAAGKSVVMMANPAGTDTAVTTPGAVVTDYFNMAYQVAQDNDLPLIDHNDSLGGFATAKANGLMYTDDIHVNAGGYALVAARTRRAIAD